MYDQRISNKKCNMRVTKDEKKIIKRFRLFLDE